MSGGISGKRGWTRGLFSGRIQSGTIAYAQSVRGFKSGPGIAPEEGSVDWAGGDGIKSLGDGAFGVGDGFFVAVGAGAG